MLARAHLALERDTLAVRALLYVLRQTQCRRASSLLYRNLINKVIIWLKSSKTAQKNLSRVSYASKLDEPCMIECAPSAQGLVLLLATMMPGHSARSASKYFA